MIAALYVDAAGIYSGLLRKAGHLCGTPPVYHVIVWVDALRAWRCTGCGRFV